MRAVEPYVPLGRRAAFAIAGLVAVIAAALVTIWADVREIQLMNRLIESGASLPAPAEAEANDDRKFLAGALVGCAFTAAMVTFIIWFFGAYRNIVALGATGLRYGTGWSIGAWFVPILNLFRPKQIANDIWRASDPVERPDQGINWREKRAAAVLTAWWALWITSLFATGWAASDFYDEPREIRNADYAHIAALLVEIAAAVLAIVVVLRITRRQADRNRRMEWSAHPLPAPWGAPVGPPA